MASMRESDTGLWLHNKLGSTDELWTPSSIGSLLTLSVIDNIRLCFADLSPRVKLKLLLGMLHLPHRTVTEMKVALSAIIQSATVDPEPWVPMVADLLKSFPVTGCVNVDLEDENPNVQDILDELREKVSVCEASAMLPLECQYLNKSALSTLVGPLVPPIKHFQLKKKPKSATLRAELLQKSTETTQQLKKPTGVPFHATGRGLVQKSDTTQFKGISKAPSTVPSTNRSPVTSARTPLRIERGVKLLDISELDVVGAGREAKKRRKTLEREAGENAAKEVAVVESKTPDYAAGLVSALSNESALPSTSYFPPTPSMVPSSSYIPSSQTQQPSIGGTKPEESAARGTAASALPGRFKQREPVYNASVSSQATPTSTARNNAPTSLTTPTSTAHNNAPSTAATGAQSDRATPPSTSAAQATPKPQPKKNLSLTREQMHAAHEIFKTANKVTRPEKALILGFMAGSRENPCPEQGDIIQIKLSEHTEILHKADGTGSTTMLVYTVFEMNYSTGQWTRIKKYKSISNVSCGTGNARPQTHTH